MRRVFTLLALMSAIIFTGKAQGERIWNGASSNVWDYSTSNWYDPSFPLPVPTSFASGANTTFNDNAQKDTVSVAGEITVGNVTFNNSTLNYVLKGTATPTLKGTGTLIKEGSGSVKTSVTNNLGGGTLIKGGTIVQSSNTDAGVFGNKVVLDGGTIRFGDKINTGTSYYTANIPIEIPENSAGKIIMNRYVNWQDTKLTGKGDIHLVVNGERILMKNTADISDFSGKIIISTIDDYDSANPAGKFIALNAESAYDYSTGTGKEEKFKNTRIQLTNGGGIAVETSGPTMFVIGELSSDNENDHLYGFYRESNTPSVEYEVGGLNTDVVFKGMVGGILFGTKTEPRSDMALGLTKVGTGTYKFTNGNNVFTKNLQIKEGRVFISNPENSSSGTGYARTGDVIIVYENGALGGTGRISGHVTVEGKLEPGEDGVGTLRIEDLKTVIDTATLSSSIKKYDLKLQATATTEMELSSASSYDKVIVDEVVYGGKLDVKLASTYNLNAGDEFQLFESNTFSGEFSEISLPNAGTWTWDTSALATEGKIKLVSGGGSGSSSTEKMPSPANEVKIYTSSTGNIEIESANDNILSVVVVSMTGSLIHTENTASNKASIQLGSAASNKVYLVKVQTESQSVVKKIIIK